MHSLRERKTKRRSAHRRAENTTGRMDDPKRGAEAGLVWLHFVMKAKMMDIKKKRSKAV